MAPVILIADDEPDLLVNCERLLEPLGYICRTASTGPKAMEFLDQIHPDLLVTDLRLPGADGLAVARHARGLVPPVPVILITAYDSAWARSAAREAGADAYLAKPFTNGAFLDILRRTLACAVSRRVDAQSPAGTGLHDHGICVSCSKPVRLGPGIAVQDGVVHIRCLAQEARLASMETRLRARDVVRAADVKRQRAIEASSRAEQLRRGGPNSEQPGYPRLTRNEVDALGNRICPACGHPVTAHDGVHVREYLVHAACQAAPSLPTAAET